MALSERGVYVWLQFRHALRDTTSRHTWLSALIARCAGCEAGEVRIADGPLGKPICAAPPAACPFHFSLSSSGEIWAAAVTTGGQVGIDVEQYRASDIEAIAEHWFSPREQQWLAGTTAGDRQSAFFRIWCRKEAFAKARGVGIDGSFADFSVVPPGSADGLHGWKLFDLEMPPGYACSVAAPFSVDHIEVTECR